MAWLVGTRSSFLAVIYHKLAVLSHSYADRTSEEVFDFLLKVSQLHSF
jgi:hypothetical protein